MGVERGLLYAALAATVTGWPARADQPPLSQSYRKVARGGAYVFVMLDPLRVEADVRWDEATTAAVRWISRTSARSGLDRNDGSTDPLWTVDWYADRHAVEVASDGVHLVRVGRWVTSPDAEAVAFFAGGRLLRSYSYRDLVGDRLDRAARTVSGYLTVFPVGRLDDARREFELGDVSGDRFVFDIRTGRIVSESRVPRPTRWGWWEAFGAAGIVGAWFAGRWLRRRTARDVEPGAVPDHGGEGFGNSQLPDRPGGERIVGRRRRGV